MQRLLEAVSLLRPLVKFSTSTVEVWVWQEATGLVRYYCLEGAPSGCDELPGLFDRLGFQPVGLPDPVAGARLLDLGQSLGPS